MTITERSHRLFRTTLTYLTISVYLVILAAILFYYFQAIFKLFPFRDRIIGGIQQLVPTIVPQLSFLTVLGAMVVLLLGVIFYKQFIWLASHVPPGLRGFVTSIVIYYVVTRDQRLMIVLVPLAALAWLFYKPLSKVLVPRVSMLPSVVGVPLARFWSAILLTALVTRSAILTLTAVGALLVYHYADIVMERVFHPVWVWHRRLPRTRFVGFYAGRLLIAGTAPILLSYSFAWFNWGYDQRTAYYGVLVAAMSYFVGRVPTPRLLPSRSPGDAAGPGPGAKSRVGLGTAILSSLLFVGWVSIALADDCSGPADCAGTTWFVNALRNIAPGLLAGIGLGGLTPFLSALFPPLTGGQVASPQRPRTPEQQERVDQIRADVARAQAEAAAANSPWGLFTQTIKNAAGEIATTTVSVVRGARDAVVFVAETGVKAVTYVGQTIVDGTKATWDAARDIYNNPSLITDTLSGSLETVKNGVNAAIATASQVGNDILEAGADVVKNPEILWETIKGTLQDVRDGTTKVVSGGWEITKAIGNSIKVFATDPHKWWETIKDSVGTENFANAVDPNRSLLQRLGQVGIGVTKIYITAVTLGQAAATLQGLKAGATKVIGEIVATGQTKGGLSQSASRLGSKMFGTGVKGGEGLLAPGARGLVKAPSSVLPELRGIPKSQLAAIEEIAKRRGVDIAVRPTNPAAMEWLKSGRAVPKPPTVHCTSISEIDTLIGAPNRPGLVGHFKPVKPANFESLSPNIQREVTERIAKREADFRKFEEGIQSLRRSGKVDVIDGVIYDARTGKPMVSDIDLGGIFKDGKPVPEDVSRWIVNEIRQRCPGVTHPDINSWYAVGAENKAIMSGTMGGHLPGRTPMAVIGPNGTSAGYFQ